MKRTLFSLASGSALVVTLYGLTVAFRGDVFIWDFPFCLLVPGFMAAISYHGGIDISSGNSTLRPFEMVIFWGVNIILYSLTAYAVLGLASRKLRKSRDSKGQ